MRDRSEFDSDQTYRYHLEHEVYATKARGDMEEYEAAVAALAALDGGQRAAEKRPRAAKAKVEKRA